MKTLVILSHPNLETSVANKTIVDVLKQSGLEIEVRHLDTIYSDYNIDVEAEQNALLSADTIIFQHPMFWYSTPPMLKIWMDKVLTYGFAYGDNGDKLKGKKFVHSFTTGGPAEAYTPTGYNKSTLDELTLPINRTANMTQMEYVKMIVSNGITPFSDGAQIVSMATSHANQLLDTIRQLAS